MNPASENFSKLEQLKGAQSAMSTSSSTQPFNFFLLAHSELQTRRKFQFKAHWNEKKSSTKTRKRGGDVLYEFATINKFFSLSFKVSKSSGSSLATKLNTTILCDSLSLPLFLILTILYSVNMKSSQQIIRFSEMKWKSNKFRERRRTNGEEKCTRRERE